MGTFYEANFGIGYIVGVDEHVDEDDPSTYFVDEDDSKVCLTDYLNSNIGGTDSPFELIFFGNGFCDNYTIAIILKDPFKTSLDVTSGKRKLDVMLKQLGLQPQSNFGVVGGVFIG